MDKRERRGWYAHRPQANPQGMGWDGWVVVVGGGVEGEAIVCLSSFCGRPSAGHSWAAAS